MRGPMWHNVIVMVKVVGVLLTEKRLKYKFWNWIKTMWAFDPTADYLKLSRWIIWQCTSHLVFWNWVKIMLMCAAWPAIALGGTQGQDDTSFVEVLSAMPLVRPDWLLLYIFVKISYVVFYFNLLGRPSSWWVEVSQRSVRSQDLVRALPYWFYLDITYHLEEEENIWIKLLPEGQLDPRGP